MAKQIPIHIRRDIQYMRAATIQVEKALRYNLNRNYTIDEIAEMGMIRKRYIRRACIESPHVKAVRRGNITAFQYDGQPPATNPYTLGPDPDTLAKKPKQRVKRKGSKS